VQLHIGLSGYDTGKRCLADTRGSVKDKVGYIARFDNTSQRFAGGEKMLLPHHIVKRRGTNQVGQRR
jgi:hypothetical protein